MNSQQMDVTNMMWRSALLRLTQIGNPDVNGGQPTVCYLDPQAITRISVVVAAFSLRANPEKRHPDVPCTEIFYCHGTLHVLESPEEVARMRDRALGHEPPKLKSMSE